MDQEVDLSAFMTQALNLSTLEVLINMSIAVVLGIVIALVYRATHKGEAYSQSFTLTIVFCAMIFSVVMIVIGTSLTRAFALVGALSVVRFQTVVKDTKDTVYIFAALVVGMSAGIGQHSIAIVAVTFFSVLALTLHKTNFGARRNQDITINLTLDDKAQTKPVVDYLDKNTRQSSIALMRPFDNGKQMQLKYNTRMRPNQTVENFVDHLAKMEGVKRVEIPKTTLTQP